MKLRQRSSRQPQAPKSTSIKMWKRQNLRQRNCVDEQKPRTTKLRTKTPLKQ
ncbi:4612_t:CDS:2 [Dentiscutata erythropus]|uniref:4612_t:CDS:1 n=1 Tax=Dentiscutata erythropus TaxID=1348616 RepID=A0A9N9K437_9GLOM|nr:4612_t:CDS:2 [Dentiscutata erythropus]